MKIVLICVFSVVVSLVIRYVTTGFRPRGEVRIIRQLRRNGEKIKNLRVQQLLDEKDRIFKFKYEPPGAKWELLWEDPRHDGAECFAYFDENYSLLGEPKMYWPKRNGQPDLTTN